MDMAQNILVIKTVSGMAMAVAAALDAMKWSREWPAVSPGTTRSCAPMHGPWMIRLAVMEKIRKIIGE